MDGSTNLKHLERKACLNSQAVRFFCKPIAGESKLIWAPVSTRRDSKETKSPERKILRRVARHVERKVAGFILEGDIRIKVDFSSCLLVYKLIVIVVVCMSGDCSLLVFSLQK